MRFANRRGLGAAVLLVSSAVIGGGYLLAAPTGAVAAASAPVTFRFTTMDNPADPAFNQLLGLNDNGTFAGYFGSGVQGHPNKGYLFQYGSYVNENYPGSMQTQVTGLSDLGISVGFWSKQNNANNINDNFGFWTANGKFHNVNYPTTNNSNPPVNQLLGLNNSDVAVGFYTDSQGNNHGYEYNIRTAKFSLVSVPGATSSTAAAINTNGDVAGFYTNSGGNTAGFLKTAAGKFTSLAVPGASATDAFGVNKQDEVVGGYTVGAGSSAVSHGFIWTSSGGFTTVDDPSGAGGTTINGVNAGGDLVGFYVDSAGNTHGFLAQPLTKQTFSVPLSSMPSGTIAVGHDQHGDLTANVQAYGLTPGSVHPLSLVGSNGAVIAALSPLTANSVGQVASTSTSTYAGSLPAGSRLVIALDTTSGSPVIARTPPLTTVTTYQLQAVEIVNGVSYGTPSGFATVVYDPTAKTITVTVNASGISPGMHAAHIHIGSCQNQGAVAYMLMDFSANSRGQIVNAVRTLTGVANPILAGTWYLNLHQGDSNQILSHGQPTSLFRPLACGQIG
jgi:hypothetical protein